MQTLAICAIALFLVAVGFVAGLLAQHPLNLRKLPEAIRELYPLTENPARDEKNYDMDDKIVVEAISLPERRMYQNSGPNKYKRRWRFDQSKGWQEQEPGFDYSEMRYRIV